MSTRFVLTGSRARMLCGSAIFAVMLGAATAAQAQSAGSKDPVEESAAESDSEIIVTGSSIRGVQIGRAHV